MRRVAKVDRNQAEIVQALRKAGASVTPTHFVGAGFPDIVVSFRDSWYLLEIKTEDGTLTQSEIEFAEYHRAMVPVVRSVEDALIAIGAL